MLNPRLAVLALLCASSLAPVASAKGATCSGRGVQVQVLGSGGPEMEDKRASSSYLVWQNGRPRILIDKRRRQRTTLRTGRRTCGST